MQESKYTIYDFFSEYKINIICSLVFTLFFAIISHFALDLCKWIVSFVESFFVSITMFIVIPWHAKIAAKIIPKLTDELISIVSFTVWLSAFCAGWLIYTGQISANGEPISRLAKITQNIFIMETNFVDNLTLSATVTILVFLVTFTSGVARKALHIERKTLCGISVFPFGVTVEYDNEATLPMKFPEFRVYIDPGRLATTLVMKCFCAAAGAIAGFAVVLKICCPKATSMHLGEILLAAMTFILPIIAAALIHEHRNIILDCSKIIFSNLKKKL